MSTYSLIALTIALLAWFLPSILGRRNAAARTEFAHRLAAGGPLPDGGKTPISVNYHFTRQCNMSCGFCFHTATTSHVVPRDEAKRGMTLLREAGTRKINFAGGEPFLYPKLLGCLIDHCKAIGIESVSIVSNGSKVTEHFLQKHGRNIDILAISCDSFDETTNFNIGRGTGSNVRQLHRVKRWCETYGIKFKLNTVVCHLNWMEDMNEHISVLSPARWKCFQVLIVKGENDSPDRLRDATKFTITSEQFEHFVEKHRRQTSLVPESNQLMAKSYLILDEYMRFLDRTGKLPSKSILDVGVDQALASVYWDVDGFYKRGGVYDWNASSAGSACRDELRSKKLQW